MPGLYATLPRLLSLVRVLSFPLFLATHTNIHMRLYGRKVHWEDCHFLSGFLPGTRVRMASLSLGFFASVCLCLAERKQRESCLHQRLPARAHPSLPPPPVRPVVALHFFAGALNSNQRERWRVPLTRKPQTRSGSGLSLTAAPAVWTGRILRHRQLRR